jgi:alkanesulfonate monooxygenase SsuD/methylene tetrahydromethanopterin reductase-like flavin-dependent oxidoreductase (luciferase family)
LVAEEDSMYLLRFDMRLDDRGAPAEEMYRAALEMTEWADDHDCMVVAFSEHHGSPDGYLSAPTVMAAAAAARTRKVPIQVAALLAALHHPVQMAEELAVLDILSGGRVSYVLGLGYRPEEFDLYGVPMDQRGARLEAAVEVMRCAWAGEPVERDDGSTGEVRVTPLPLTPGGPLLLMGGGTPAAARRAARLGLGMITERTGDLEQHYVEACRALGREPGMFVGGGDATVVATFVDHDPDAAWERLGPFLLHDACAYAEWNVGAAKPLPGAVVDVQTVEEVRAAGRYRVYTPDEAVEHVRTSGPLVLHPLCGGTPPDLGWSTLHLVADEVLPQFG